MDRIVDETRFGVSLSITIAIFAASFLVSVLLDRTQNRNKQSLVRALLIAYIYFVLAITLLGRTPEPPRHAMLIPLWSWRAVFENGRPLWYLEEIGLNILLFVPLGILLRLNWEKMKLWQAVLIGFSSSACIESTQYVTCLGLFEWDDMIHNTLGCLIGAAIFGAIRKRRSRQERM